MYTLIFPNFSFNDKKKANIKIVNQFFLNVPQISNTFLRIF